MERTKLGISATLMGVILCLLGWFGGYVIVGIAVGYVLLKEDNAQIRRQAVKVLAVMLMFSVVSYVLGLPGDVMSVLYHLMSMFGIHEGYSNFVNELMNFLSVAWNLCRSVVFLLMAANAASNKEFKVPVVDALLDKYMPEETPAE